LAIFGQAEIIVLSRNFAIFKFRTMKKRTGTENGFDVMSIFVFLGAKNERCSLFSTAFLLFFFIRRSFLLTPFSLSYSFASQLIAGSNERSESTMHSIKCSTKAPLPRGLIPTNL
jgi:hypothetical protein